jgi:hypothetical protein
VISFFFPIICLEDMQIIQMQCNNLTQFMVNQIPYNETYINSIQVTFVFRFYLMIKLNCFKLNMLLAFSCRHALWILGNGLTLINNKSIWNELVLDAKTRGCFFSASDDLGLGEMIKNTVKELVEPRRRLNQDELLVQDFL